MSEAQKEMPVKQLSRRKFVVGAGAAGVLAAGGILGITDKSMAAGAPIKVLVNGREVSGPAAARLEKNVVLAPVRTVAEAMGASVAWNGASKSVNIYTGNGYETASAVGKWPFTYQKIDPAAVRKRGYEYYSSGGCMYGAAAAIISILQEQLGGPYNGIPLEMFNYGAGGAVGWGTLCGTLNGAGAALNLVSKDYGKILNELIGWYTVTPFPSTDHDAYSKFQGQVQSVSNSPLCHASVSDWCKASGKKVNDPERLDRCAKLTGDVAAKAIEYLNAAVDGKFIASYKPSQEFEGCLGCHSGAESLLNNEQGKMNCVSCHDPH